MPSKPYTTTDFYLAAFLNAAGYPFLGLRVDDKGRGTFAFEDVTEQDITAYYNSSETHRVSALGLVDAIKNTRAMLYNSPR